MVRFEVMGLVVSLLTLCVQVCQAKCIKCGKYGHMNTDKRCHLYGKSVDHDAPIQSVDQDKLMEEMKADGLAMR